MRADIGVSGRRSGSPGGAEPVRAVGSRLELFVDDWLIDTAHGTRLQLHRPVPREVILQIDQPWEKIWMEQPEKERQEQIARGVWNGPTPFGFSTVTQDGDLYRLYYTWDRSGQPSMTGYAESRDGIHWTKPNLGIRRVLGRPVAEVHGVLSGLLPRRDCRSG